MTRDEILEYFKDVNHAYNDCTRYDTLKRMLDELQEPCDDAISRAEVLSHAKKDWGNGHEQPFDYVEVDVIKQLPPVKPTEKTGQWIYEKRKRLINETDEGPEYITDYWCKCSRCGGDFGYRKMDDAFCKYCGAMMQEVSRNDIDS